MGAETGAPELTAVLMEAARVAFAEQGLVLVPVEPDDRMLRAVDDDGDRIWDGGTEHYFRSEAEAFSYGRQVWRGMVRASRDVASVP